MMRPAALLRLLCACLLVHGSVAPSSAKHDVSSRRRFTRDATTEGEAGITAKLIELTGALSENSKAFTQALSALAELAGPLGSIFGTAMTLFGGSSDSAELEAIKQLGKHMDESFANLDRKLDQMQEENRFHELRMQYQQYHEKLRVLHRLWIALGPNETRADNTDELKRHCADAYSSPVTVMEEIRDIIVEKSGVLEMSLFHQLIETYFDRAYSSELRQIVLIDLAIGQLLTPICDTLLGYGMAKIREDENNGMLVYFATHTYMAQKMQSVYKDEYKMVYGMWGRSNKCSDGAFDSSCEWRSWLEERFDAPQHGNVVRVSAGPAEHHGGHLLPGISKDYDKITYDSDRQLYFAIRYAKSFQVRTQVHEVDSGNDDGITNFDNGLLYDFPACTKPPCQCVNSNVKFTKKFNCGDSTCDYWTANFAHALACTKPPLTTQSCPVLRVAPGTTLVYADGSRVSQSTATLSRTCDKHTFNHTVICMDGTWSDVVYDCLRVTPVPQRHRRVIVSRGEREPAMSLIGKRVRFRSVNFPGHYMRLTAHDRVVRMDKQSDHYGHQIFHLDSIWEVVPGLAGSGVSLRSTRFPLFYVRHHAGRLFIAPYENQLLYKKDASFNVIEPLSSDGALSFQSVNYPDHYVRHSGFLLHIAPNDESSVFSLDASWIAEIEHVLYVPFWTAISFTDQYCDDENAVSADDEAMNQADCLAWCSQSGNQFCSRVAASEGTGYRCISSRRCRDPTSSDSKRPSYIWLKDPVPYCPTGYTMLEGSGKCYKAFDEARSWFDAAAFCQRVSRGGQLASITSWRQEDFVQSVAQAALREKDWVGRSTGSGPWIGANERTTEGEFRWADSTLVTYTNWHHNEPDNNSPNSDEDCVHFLNERISGRQPRAHASLDFLQGWNNHNCSVELPFICEAPWMLPRRQTTACPLGYHLLEGSGKCFKIGTEGRNWDDAESECERDYGHLASVTDFREEHFIRRLAHEALGHEHDWAGCWLGATTGDSYGEFRWVDDTPFEYANWIGSAENATNSGDCAHFTWFNEHATGLIRGHHAGWVGSDCQTKLPFVCQVPSLGRVVPQ